MDFQSLHQILRDLYDVMMPMCISMATLAKGIAGLGALFYIGYRVWASLANAEPIDIFPLLRPFAICLCIMFFPTLVIGTMNAVLSPLVVGTHQLLEEQTMDMREMQATRDRLKYEALLNNPEAAYLVSNEAFDEKIESMGWGIKSLATMGAMYLNRWEYNMRNTIRGWFRELLELVFHAVALCIDTIRTFFLVVLSILGPISFALSVFDGFQSTLTMWISKYVGTYLWLPIADVFSCILAKLQVLMLQRDIEQLQATQDTSIIDASHAMYIVFMIIGILGYFTIPFVASWIVTAGGGGALNRHVNRTAVAIGQGAKRALIRR